VIKVCEICDNEFETVYTNKKYCSEECSREAIREADRLRKLKKREVIRKKQTAEEMERRRLKMAEIEKRTEEIARESKADLEKRLKAGDPFARMRIAKPNSKEYWEAYKQYEIEYAASWNKESTRTVNGVSVHDPYFSQKVVQAIKDLGVIETRL